MDNSLTWRSSKTYAPTIDAEEKVDEFYDQVQFEVDRTCKQEVLLVTGGLNTQAENIKEKNVVGLHDLGNQNEAGNKCINLCHSNEWHFLQKTKNKMENRNLAQ